MLWVSPIFRGALNLKALQTSNVIYADGKLLLTFLTILYGLWQRIPDLYDKFNLLKQFLLNLYNFKSSKSSVLLDSGLYEIHLSF